MKVWIDSRTAAYGSLHYIQVCDIEMSAETGAAFTHMCA